VGGGGETKNVDDHPVRTKSCLRRGKRNLHDSPIQGPKSPEPTGGGNPALARPVPARKFSGRKAHLDWITTIEKKSESPSGSKTERLNQPSRKIVILTGGGREQRRPGNSRPWVGAVTSFTFVREKKEIYWSLTAQKAHIPSFGDAATERGISENSGRSFSGDGPPVRVSGEGRLPSFVKEMKGPPSQKTITKEICHNGKGKRGVKHSHTTTLFLHPLERSSA